MQPPPAIFMINGDITYPPPPPIFIGANPLNPTSDAGVSELSNLQIQLFIDDTMTKAEFDARLVADPNYPLIVHLQGLRILVILPINVPFCELKNLEWADVVMFLHQGLADVEKNCFGPPGQNYDFQRITPYSILRAAHHGGDCIVPFAFRFRDKDGYGERFRSCYDRDFVFGEDRCELGEGHEGRREGHHEDGEDHKGSFGGNCCSVCRSPFYCDTCHTFSGIAICHGCKCRCRCYCNVHAPNCDNETHNWDFIHRK
jgi:hypothetical protein